MQGKKTEIASKGVAKLLKSVLVSSANTTSCAVFHQPKAPNGLKKFRKES